MMGDEAKSDSYARVLAAIADVKSGKVAPALLVELQEVTAQAIQNAIEVNLGHRVNGG